MKGTAPSPFPQHQQSSCETLLILRNNKIISVHAQNILKARTVVALYHYARHIDPVLPCADSIFCKVEKAGK